MNLFYLSDSFEDSVRCHLDSHCTKIITEAVQILSTNYHILSSGKVEPFLFKPTHANHPCTIWARECYENFMWVVHYGIALHNEYKFRYGKNKYLKEWQILNFCFANPPELPWNDGLTTPFKMALPDDCRISDNPVECYRKYYNTHKRHLFFKKDGTPRWTNRQIPNWIEL